MLVPLTVVESNKRCKQIRELVITESQNKPLSVLQLLMNAAKLELKLREVRHFGMSKKLCLRSYSHHGEIEMKKLKVSNNCWCKSYFGEKNLCMCTRKQYQNVAFMQITFN